MGTFSHTTELDAPRNRVWAWHARSGALERLLPPWRDVQLLHQDAELRDGARAELELRLGPISTRWVAVHHDVIPGLQFFDEQVEGPFHRWRHEHRFEDAGEGTTRLIDEIEYELPGGWIAEQVAAGCVERELSRTFRWRHERTARDLARHALVDGERSLRIAVTGASGLVGSALVPFLRSGGHRVYRLVRRAPRGADEIHWLPADGQIDAGALEGLDGIVHLAGESVAGIRWSELKKRRIHESRVEGTRLLARTLADLARPPRVLVSASAIGYYGDRGDEELDEEAPPGSGFLSRVSREWEAASAPAEEAGIRVVRLRIGVVLSPAGGALRKMLPAFRIGLGAVPGSGTDWVSWIALDDLVGVVHRALLDERLHGVLNATAPQPVTHETLARTLARVLGRPAPFHIPESALLAVGGEAIEETVLASARVLPARLRASGFRFFSPDLESALRFELGRLEQRSPDAASPETGAAGRENAQRTGKGDSNHG